MFILDRYLARDILRTFALALAAFAVVFLLASLYELLREGYAPQLVLTLLPFAVAYTIPYLVPIALVIGCALAYGRMAADNEVIPVLSAGQHPRVLLTPGLAIGLAVTIVMVGVQATLVPYAYGRKRGVLKKLLEDLAALPTAENKVLEDGRRGFFFFARRTAGPEIEGLELCLFPGLLELTGGQSRAAGRVELEAARGLIQKSASGGIEVEVEDARVTYFELVRLDLESLPREGEGPEARLTPEGWFALEERLGRVEAPAPLPADAPAEAIAARSSADRARHQLAAERMAPHDKDLDGRLDEAELKAYLATLDVTEVPTRAVSQLRLASFAFEIAPEARTSFRLEFQPSYHLAALRGRLAGWFAFAASPIAMSIAEANAAALHAGAIAGPLGAPIAPVGLAALGGARPGRAMSREVERLDRHAAVVEAERWSLALAPFLFAVVASTLPLLLHANNRLVPFFLAFCAVGLTYFVPFMVAQGITSKGRGAGPWAFWIPVALTAALGIVLIWRLCRR